ALVVLFLSFWICSGERIEQRFMFDSLYAMDGFTQWVKQLVLICAFAVLLMGMPFVEKDRLNTFEFPVLCLLSTLGMMVVISANHFLLFYLGLELQSLGLYVLVAYQRDSVKAGEAALKYFVLGVLASIFILYGMSFVYGFAGTLDFQGIAEELRFVSAGSIPVTLSIGGVMILLGICFKLAVAPMHMWAPDVYEGSSVPVAAFLSSAPKLAALGILIRLLYGPFGELLPSWSLLLQILAATSMIWGSVAALYQVRLRRLLAYSTVAHMGYVFMGLASGTIAGAQGALIYMTLYAVMIVGVFAFLLGWRRKDECLEDIQDLSGLSQRRPLQALMFSVLMFSMAGIPPLGGFFAKLSVFSAAAESGLYPLMIIAALFSVVGAVYYLRLVKVIYFDEVGAGSAYWGGEVVLHRRSLSIAFLSAGIVALFIFSPSSLISWAEAAIQSYVNVAP
ncbi:MAG: NADH-quinone oxidoreductase subunit N, partial [bacterium]|nr:NADH-quinone oxidoreductase subunit N [bacterium]